MNQNDIAVLVLFFEKPQQTVECLQSFLPSGVPLYVLNNGSSAVSTRIVRSFVDALPQIRFLEVPRNIGVAAGRNTLTRETTEQWLFFVDNDARVTTPAWREQLEAHSAAHPDVEAFIPRIFNVHDGTDNRWGDIAIENGVLWQKKEASTLSNIFPGTALVRRSVFQRLGGYDEAMFVGYEDLEIAVRAVLSGEPIRARRIDDIVLAHEHRLAITPQDRHAVRERYKSKNNLHSLSYLLNKHRLKWGGKLAPRWLAMKRGRLAGGWFLRRFWAIACWWKSRGVHADSEKARR